MNMIVRKKSNKDPLVGDIFVFELKQAPGRLHFGRVVRTDAAVGGFKKTILIYIFRATSSSVSSEIPNLKPSDLLLPPMATNKLPWTKGYFQTVKNQPLSAADALERHFFRGFGGKLYDDSGMEIDRASEPIGEYGLQSYRTIDDAISKALGYPMSD